MIVYAFVSVDDGAVVTAGVFVVVFVLVVVTLGVVVTSGVFVVVVADDEPSVYTLIESIVNVPQSIHQIPHLSSPP